MLRRWFVRPDEILVTDEGDVQAVSRQLAREAFMDAEGHLANFGGTLNIVSMRQPTGLPGEMVTAALMFEWRDMPESKNDRPEVASSMPTAAEPAPAPATDVVELEPEPVAIPDLLVDDEGEPEEDVSSIPERARAEAIA